MRIEDRLRQGLHDQADRSGVEPAGVDDAIGRARRQRVQFGAVVAVIALLVGVGAVVAFGDPRGSSLPIIDQPDEMLDDRVGDSVGKERGDEAEEPTGASDCRELEDPAADTAAAPGWSSLPAPPFVRARATSVWAEDQLLYFGGDTEFGDTRHNDAASFDLGDGRWRCLPRAPMPGQSAAHGVWTGAEVLIVGDLAPGAAYDPTTGAWRRLPEAPITASSPVAAVWTGERMIVWGDRSRDNPRADGAVYDPQTDQWMPIAEAPMALNVADAAWTGSEMIVMGAQQDDNNFATTDHAVGLAYDPATDTWRTLASSPLSPQASTITWTGESLVAVDYVETTAVYDPVSDRWEQVEEVPFVIGECPPQSALIRDAVFVIFCRQAALFGLETHTWTVVGVPDTDVFGRPVSTGDVVLIAGAAHEGGYNALWQFDPAAAPAAGGGADVVEGDAG